MQMMAKSVNPQGTWTVRKYRTYLIQESLAIAVWSTYVKVWYEANVVSCVIMHP